MDRQGRVPETWRNVPYRQVFSSFFAKFVAYVFDNFSKFWCMHQKFGKKKKKETYFCMAWDFQNLKIQFWAVGTRLPDPSLEKTREYLRQTTSVTIILHY